MHTYDAAAARGTAVVPGLGVNSLNAFQQIRRRTS